MIKIAPSLLSADFSILAQEIQSVEAGGAEYLHLDIMDGNFVPNLTFGPPVIQALRQHSNMFFDAHLMVEHPQEYIPALVKAGVDGITIHAEAAVHAHRILGSIKEHGVQAGISLNPGTSLTVVEELLPEVDLVLLMSVNPGFGGQKYITATTDKISRLASWLQKRAIKAEIQVDGGITPANAKEVILAGATILVAGSSIFGQKDRQQAISNLRCSAESLHK